MTSPELPSAEQLERISSTYADISLDDVDQWREFLARDSAALCVNLTNKEALPHPFTSVYFNYEKYSGEMLGKVETELRFSPSFIDEQQRDTWQRDVIAQLQAAAKQDGMQTLTLAHEPFARYFPVHPDYVIRVEARAETNLCEVSVSLEDANTLKQTLADIDQEFHTPTSPDAYETLHHCLTMWSHAVDICTKDYGYEGDSTKTLSLTLSVPEEDSEVASEEIVDEPTKTPTPAASPSAEKTLTRDSQLERQESDVGFDHIVGCDNAKIALEDLSLLYRYPDAAANIGLTNNKAVLLRGPVGVGKKTLARALAGQFGIPFIDFPTTQMASGVSGSTARAIDSFFKELVKITTPTVLTINDFELISATNINSAERQAGITRLAYWTDIITAHHHNIMLVGTTSSEAAIDPLLAQVNRFQIVDVEKPSDPERLSIWQMKLGQVAAKVIVIQGYNDNPDAITLKLDHTIDYDVLAAGSRDITGAQVNGVVDNLLRKRLVQFVRANEVSPITQQDLLGEIAALRL